jgi:hypothetical protein
MSKDSVNEKEIVYLIQPCELIETLRYKVGCSYDGKNLSRLKTGYKKGSRRLCIKYCNDCVKLEKIIIRVFMNSFRLIAGNEFFEGNENEMIELFEDIVNDWKNNDGEKFNNFLNEKSDIKTKYNETSIVNTNYELEEINNINEEKKKYINEKN